MELETSRTTEASTPFTVGERTFYVVTEVVTMRGARGRMFAASVSPIALLVLEPHDRYVISFTDKEVTVDELLIRVPALKGKVSAQGVS